MTRYSRPWSHTDRAPSGAASPPPLRPANDNAPDWRKQGPAAQVIGLPPREAPKPQPVLEVNRQPVQDLRTLIERLGRSMVERQLNVHRTTVLRWLDGKVKIPGAKHHVIRMLLGDLPGTDGKWTGWRFQGGQLYSPANDRFEPGHVLSLVLLRQQLAARDRENAALRVKLAMAEQTIERLSPAANSSEAGFIGHSAARANSR